MSRRPVGHDGARCGSRKRQGEGTCEREAGWGTDHLGEGPCKLHGGSTSSVSKGATLNLIRRETRELVRTYGLRLDVTPTEALLEEVQWTAGHVAYLRARIQEIEDPAEDDAQDPDGSVRGNRGRHPLVWGVTKIKTGGDDYGTTEEAGPNAWLRVYQEERAHLARICADAIRCGIEERKVKLAEQQGQLVADVIRKILGDLDLTPEQQARVPEVVPMRLRALAG